MTSAAIGSQPREAITSTGHGYSYAVLGWIIVSPNHSEGNFRSGSRVGIDAMKGTQSPKILTLMTVLLAEGNKYGRQVRMPKVWFSHAQVHGLSRMRVSDGYQGQAQDGPSEVYYGIRLFKHGYSQVETPGRITVQLYSLRGHDGTRSSCSYCTAGGS